MSWRQAMSESQKTAALAVLDGLRGAGLGEDAPDFIDSLARCFGVALFLRGGLGIDAEVVRRENEGRPRAAVRMGGRCVGLDGHEEPDGDTWTGIVRMSNHDAVIQRFAVLSATVYQAWLLDAQAAPAPRRRV